MFYFVFLNSNLAKNEPRISNCTLTSYGIKWRQTLNYKSLRYSDLHDIDFSAKPYSVNCEDICQVTFIVVILNATKYCNESKVLDWECGLEELTRNFSYKLNSINVSSSTRTYSIRNPVETQKIWLPCTGSSKTKCNKYFNKLASSMFQGYSVAIGRNL